jgi:hypothetical protein
MSRAPPPTFKRLRTTAALEFQRLLRAGEAAILHLPAQHSATLRYVLALHGLTLADAKSVAFEAEVKLQHDRVWSPVVRWRAAKRVASLPEEALSALALARLFEFVETGAYAEQPLEGRLCIRNELLIIWWSLFVIPELESRGHSRAQSRNRSRTNSRAGSLPATSTDVEQHARQLHRKGVPRNEAREILLRTYAFGGSQANRVLAKAGYVASRGRKRRAAEMRNPR